MSTYSGSTLRSLIGRHKLQNCLPSCLFLRHQSVKRKFGFGCSGLRFGHSRAPSVSLKLSPASEFPAANYLSKLDKKPTCKLSLCLITCVEKPHSARSPYMSQRMFNPLPSFISKISFLPSFSIPLSLRFLFLFSPSLIYL